MQLSIRALVFDAYGTLFDVHSIRTEIAARHPLAAEQISETWRQKQLEYSWLASLMGRYQDFWQLTRAALCTALEASGVAPHRDLVDPLMEAYQRLASYREVPQALAALTGYRRAIFSNGAPHMLAAVVAHNGLEDAFDAVLSVDPAQVFKPHPKAYALVPQALDVSASQVLFASSNSWDVAGAKSFGFETVWIRRQNAVWDRLGVEPDHIARTLDELTAIVG